jgi:hypothetical protein
MPRNCRLSCCGTKGSNPSPSSEGSYKLDHRLELSRSASKQPKACPPRQPPNLFEFQQACFVPQAFCDPNATKGNPGAHYDTSIALDLHFSETPPNKCPGPMQCADNVRPRVAFTSVSKIGNREARSCKSLDGFFSNMVQWAGWLSRYPGVVNGRVMIAHHPPLRRQGA